MSFMDLKAHILIHLHDEVELVEAVSWNLMIFLERHENVEGTFYTKGKRSGDLWWRGR